MKLEFEQIRSICLGSVRAAKTEEGVRLYRFTEEQEEIYRQEGKVCFDQIYSAAGMKIHFETDSSFLFLKVNVMPASVSRMYFSFDITVNGRLLGALDNYSDVTLPQDYTLTKLALGEFSKTFFLGEGSKEVCIYLPWSVAVEIRELSLDDNAFIKPVKPTKKLLVFGDSISQGYDGLRPSKHYAVRLAEALDAEEINKGMGGEGFFPALVKVRDDFEPDYITVAYGTNDWGSLNEEDFKSRCRTFYDLLSKTYPNAKIFAITPIWRKDYLEEKTFGDFFKVAEYIESIVKDLKNITCIHGFKFIPQDENYYADLWLHPNDRGFDSYFLNLYEQIAGSSCDEDERIGV